MKKTLAEQLAELQGQGVLPKPIKHKRTFPLITGRQIERGAVVYIPLSEEEGLVLKGKYKERDKWIVIIGVSDDDYIVGSLLVNTSPNNFTKELGDIQFPLLKRHYPFLDYQSWLDCSELFKIPRTKVLKNGGYCGKINMDDWTLIWETLKDTEFISEEEKEEFGIL